MGNILYPVCMPQAQANALRRGRIIVPRILTDNHAFSTNEINLSITETLVIAQINTKIKTADKLLVIVGTTFGRHYKIVVGFSWYLIFV